MNTQINHPDLGKLFEEDRIRLLFCANPICDRYTHHRVDATSPNENNCWRERIMCTRCGKKSRYRVQRFVDL